MAALRRIRLLALVALIAGALAAWGAPPAYAGGGGTAQIVTQYSTYGANATILATGAIDYVSSCPGAGKNDFITPVADVYLVLGNQTFTDGMSIGQLAFGGQPTATITALDESGGFVDQTIGFTKPTGALPSGSYEIVLDECQDGIFHAGIDEYFPQAFQVTIPTNVPPPDPSIAALKADAANQATFWQEGAQSFTAINTVNTLLSRLSDVVSLTAAVMSGDPLEVLDAAGQVVVGFAYEQGINSLAEQLGASADAAATNLMNARANNYKEIAADPPDPHYQQITPLQARTTYSAGSSDPIMNADAEMATTASTEQALGQAFLDSLQRYEGAQQAGDGTWALIHAREVQQYAALLAQDLPATTSTLNHAASAVANDAFNLDQAASNLEQIRSAVGANGFTPQEEQALVNAGYTPSQINQLRTTLANESLTVTRTQTVSDLNAIASANSTMAADFQTFANGMQSDINVLQADPNTFDAAPIANAGGPYSGTQGTPISLDATGSTVGAAGLPIASYQWDTQGTGSFTTSGKTISVTYDHAFSGMVGVKVTNADGFSSVAYVPITVSGTNSPPSITGHSPNSTVETTVPIGQSQQFSVTTTDAENDPTNVQWTVDGTAAGTGSAFAYSPSAADEGEHILQAVATDANDPNDGFASQSWLVAACPAAGPPGTPSNVQATAGNGSAAVAWTAPSQDCGSAITSYVVITSTGQTLTVDSTHTSARITGLTNGTPVSFTVTAVNPMGAGAPSSPSAPVTPSGTPPPPPQGTASPGYAASAFATDFTNVPCCGNPNPVGPVGVTFDSANNFYAADVANGTVYKFGPGGGSTLDPATAFSQLGGNSQGLAFDKSGHLFVAHVNDNKVLELDPTTGAVLRTVANIGCPTGMAVDPLSGDLLLTGNTPGVGGCNRQVIRIHNPDSASPVVSTYAVPGGDSDGITIGPDGTIYIENSGCLKVIAGTNKPNAGTITSVPNCIAGMDGVAIAANPQNPGQPGLVYENTNFGDIWQVDLSTSPVTASRIFSGGTRGDFVAVGPDGCLYATQSSSVLKLTKSDGTCNLAPTSGAPQISLACSSSSSTGTVGSPISVSGTFDNVSNPSGLLVSFITSGANPGSDSTTANSSGTATLTYTGNNTGVDTIVAVATVNGQSVTSNPCQVTWMQPTLLTPTLTYAGAVAGDYNDTVTVSGTLKDGSGNPIAGKLLTFTIGTQSCTSSTTDTSGNATCSIMLTQTPGTSYSVVATFGGDATVAAASSAPIAFTISREETALTYTGATSGETSDTVTLSAKLTEGDGTTPVGGKQVTFTLGSQTCTPAGATDSSGNVSCILTLSQAPSSTSVKVSFAGDTNYAPTGVSPAFTLAQDETKLTYTGATAGQYGQQVTLSATLTEGDGTTALSGKQLTFTLGTQSCTPASSTDSTGSASCALVLNQPKGSYTVKAAFAGDTSFQSASASSSFAVSSQPAVVTPAAADSNPFQVGTAGGTASVALTATVAGTLANGSISKSLPVTYALQPVGSGSGYTCTDSAGTGVISGAIGSKCSLSSVAVNVYTLTVSVNNGYYVGSATTVVTVFDPSLGFTTGGGWILHNGVRANFGFNAKYLKSGQIQGSMLYVEHRASGDVIAKSNSMGSLSIIKPTPPATAPYTAYLQGKATDNGVGNYSFMVSAIDYGTPGTSDRFGLQLNDPSGAVVPDLTFQPITLGGGNIVVPHS